MVVFVRPICAAHSVRQTDRQTGRETIEWLIDTGIETQWYANDRKRVHFKFVTDCSENIL